MNRLYSFTLGLSTSCDPLSSQRLLKLSQLSCGDWSEFFISFYPLSNNSLGEVGQQGVGWIIIAYKIIVKMTKTIVSFTKMDFVNWFGSQRKK